MKVRLDALAWLEKAALTATTLVKLREELTVLCEGFGKDLTPIKLFVETDTHIGIPRAYYLARRKSSHDVEDLTQTNREGWPGQLAFCGALRPEQQQALTRIHDHLRQGGYGGLLQAPPGWGKTVWSCALIEKLRVPTLVLVHKEFLMDQWAERLRSFLPSVRIGRVQGDVCETSERHVAIGMVQSISQRDYGPRLYQWPGLVINDECHRVGAPEWAPVPMRFPARWRVGITATPKRKDGADPVFFYHLGDILFRAEEQRLKPGVRYVFTEFRLSQYDKLNTNLSSRGVVLNLMAANPERNRSIFDQLVAAVSAGRKLLVVSERIEHLERLHTMVSEEWPTGIPIPSVSFYIGGLTREEQRQAEKAQVILATSQLVTEGLDIPALDTLFLTMPLSNVEQAVGRILRPHEGKKPPVVVDFRDDRVGLFRGQAQERMKVYAKMGA